MSDFYLLVNEMLCCLSFNSQNIYIKRSTRIETTNCLILAFFSLIWIEKNHKIF